MSSPLISPLEPVSDPCRRSWLGVKSPRVSWRPAARRGLLHEIVQEEAPHLDPKTWYGFPSYARDGKVVVFFTPRTTFDERYASLGFNTQALLDDGDFWPTAFAILAMTPEVEAKVRGLVRRAAG